MSMNMMTERQEKLLERLWGVLAREPKNMVKLAKEMGINYVTLRKFLDGDQSLQFKQLCLVEKYIVEHEGGVRAQ